MFDTIIRNGLIYDGSGGEPLQGDVAIKDGCVVETGEVGGSARETIDADGAIVTSLGRYSYAL